MNECNVIRMMYNLYFARYESVDIRINDRWQYLLVLRVDSNENEENVRSSGQSTNNKFPWNDVYFTRVNFEEYRFRKKKRFVRSNTPVRVAILKSF